LHLYNNFFRADCFGAKKGGEYVLKKLRSASGAILSFLHFSFLTALVFLFISLPVRAQPDPL
jgi:hypothetical protein